jgi:hypothetical protein
MLSGLRFLQIRRDDQKRLQREFSDRRIRYGYNVRTKSLEAWYVPDNSRPYKITGCDSVAHCIYVMKARLITERTRAKDLLRRMDEHNDKLHESKEDDVMHEVRSTLRSVASGRVLFTPPARQKYANV